MSGMNQKYGRSSWELDALDPATLDALIQQTIEQYRDNDLWLASLAKAREGRELLRTVAQRWGDVVQVVGPDGQQSAQ